VRPARQGHSAVASGSLGRRFDGSEPAKTMSPRALDVFPSLSLSVAAHHKASFCGQVVRFRANVGLPGLFGCFAKVDAIDPALHDDNRADMPRMLLFKRTTVYSKSTNDEQARYVTHPLPHQCSASRQKYMIHAQHCPHYLLRCSSHPAASLTGTILDGAYHGLHLDASANTRVFGNGMLTLAVKSDRLELP
jgi:hypothetical protein